MLQLLLQRASLLALFEELVTLWQFSSFRNQLEFFKPEYNPVTMTTFFFIVTFAIQRKKFLETLNVILTYISN